MNVTVLWVLTFLTLFQPMGYDVDCERIGNNLTSLDCEIVEPDNTEQITGISKGMMMLIDPKLDIYWNTTIDDCWYSNDTHSARCTIFNETR